MVWIQYVLMSNMHITLREELAPFGTQLQGQAQVRT